MRRRIADLPLHTGKAPRWLFERMHRLAGAIVELIVADRGPGEMLERLADPFWFQAFGCVLGFDWHSSGLTTVTCGAVAEAYRRSGGGLGIHVAGGKGAVSRETPQRIERIAQRRALPGDRLIHASRLSAKVDSSAVQDGFDIYAHFFFFTDAGDWCVVQQGMNDASGYARRYHWLGNTVTDFVCEPHHAVASDPVPDPAGLLNMTAAQAVRARDLTAELARMRPDRLLREITVGESLFLPRHHAVLPADIDPRRLHRVLSLAHHHQPPDFAGLLRIPGVGPRTIRSLALIAELVYGVSPPRQDVSRRWSPADPATFSYAHGGKDGHPFPVDRATYDRSIALLEQAVRGARVGPAQRDEALYRLSRLLNGSSPI